MLARLRHAWQKLLLAPLWQCGFRPFFLFTAVAAVCFMPLWALFLLYSLPLPISPAGPFVWHAHEMLFGFTTAALAGFVLTAVPEFTATPSIPPRTVLCLSLLWLGGRLAWLAASWPAAVAMAALCDTGLLAALLLTLAPRLWQDPERRHLSFLWTLAALLGLSIGFYADIWRNLYPMRWLLAFVGMLMVLIVVAMSRISMRIVNKALQEYGTDGNDYLARAPRRNLAVFCIVLYSAGEFIAPTHPTLCWLALAAAAAMLNLLNDWHVGTVLLRRWVLMLYGVYCLMASGYALIALSLFGFGQWLSSGRHILMVGALSLAVFSVMNIAGRVHAGVHPDERYWVPIGVLLLLGATLLRAAYPAATGGLLMLGLAAACWTSVFVLHLWRNGLVLTTARRDGQLGCGGIADVTIDSNTTQSTDKQHPN